jgi:hypothetical protein
MPFIRKIANSDVLSGIIDIPVSMKNKKVEILVFSLDDTAEEEPLKPKAKSARGVLSKYKNPELIDKESTAWEMAMGEKHENR